MIDLAKPQILPEPIKCWVRDLPDKSWEPRWLVAIENGMFWCIEKLEHDIELTIRKILVTRKVIFRFCTLTDPYAKTKRQMTHAEVFKAITNGAIIGHKEIEEFVINYWVSSWEIDMHKICYDYTGTDADVWQPMEVEE